MQLIFSQKCQAKNVSQGQHMRVGIEKEVGKLGQQFSIKCIRPIGALPTCNNENSIHHLEESIGQGEADHLDHLLSSERQLEHGDAHLNILSSSF